MKPKIDDLTCRLIAFATFVAMLCPSQAVASGTEARRAYVAGKHLLAMQLAQPAAERGDSTAMLVLGTLYFRGEGVRQNYTAALKWWRASAALGDRRAQHNIGILFRSGLGVERNYDEAIRWFELSAGKGEALAHWSLGSMYESGEGRAKDIKEALELYQKAIDLLKLELATEPERARDIQSSIKQLTWRTQWLTSLLEQGANKRQ